MLGWLDDIEAQLDDTVPHYVPRLIAEIRRLSPPCCGEDHVVGERADDCFACLADQRDELLAVLKAVSKTDDDCPMCDRGRLRNPQKTHWPECPFGRAQALIDKVAYPPREGTDVMDGDEARP